MLHNIKLQATSAPGVNYSERLFKVLLELLARGIKKMIIIPIGLIVSLFKCMERERQEPQYQVLQPSGAQVLDSLSRLAANAYLCLSYH